MNGIITLLSECELANNLVKYELPADLTLEPIISTSL